MLVECLLVLLGYFIFSFMMYVFLPTSRGNFGIYYRTLGDNISVQGS